jgi:chorismate--pyruvate lyase
LFPLTLERQISPLIKPAPDIADSSILWLPLAQSSLNSSNEWWDWITNPGSLTKRLKEKSAGNFQVELVEEKWQSSLPQDLRALFGPVGKDHRFWSRKVVLLGRSQPWIQAHTLLPEHSLESPLREVMELNEKPLGEYLFNHPELIRTEMDVTAVGSDTWARRSLFYLFNKPVLVAEFFLPHLLEKS